MKRSQAMRARKRALDPSRNTTLALVAAAALASISASACRNEKHPTSAISGAEQPIFSQAYCGN